MTEVNKSDPIEVMGEAYELMLENILRDLHIKEKTDGPPLSELIEKAKNEAIAQGTLSEGHIKKFAESLKALFEKNKD